MLTPGQAFGYAVGADTQWCPHLRAGIALGQMFGDCAANGGLAEVEQNSAMACWPTPARPGRAANAGVWALRTIWGPAATR